MITLILQTLMYINPHHTNTNKNKSRDNKSHSKSNTSQENKEMLFLSLFSTYISYGLSLLYENPKPN